MLRTVINQEFQHIFEDRSAENFESIWNLESVRIFSTQRTSDVHVVRFPARTHGAGRAVLKRYWYPSLSDRLKGFFRNTFFGMCRAAREFRSLSRLGQVNCSLVRPIAAGEDRTVRLLKRAFILTEHIPGTRSLEEILRSPAFTTWPHAQRRRLAAHLGAWVRAIHDRGFHDRDLFGRNILVHRSLDRSEPVRAQRCGFVLSKIDSSAATGGRAQPGTGRPFLRDLIDLDRDVGSSASEQDLLRFLLAYLAAFGLNSEVRTLVGHIRQHSVSTSRQ